MKQGTRPLIGMSHGFETGARRSEWQSEKATTALRSRGPDVLSPGADAINT